MNEDLGDMMKWIRNLSGGRKGAAKVVEEDELTTEAGYRDDERMKAAIIRILADEAKTTAKGGYESFVAEYGIKPVEPEKKVFKNVTTVAHCWEAENLCDGSEIERLTTEFRSCYNEGIEVATETFERAETGGIGIIDEDGTDVRLSRLPYSPYTDEGAAFCIGVVYRWRELEEVYQANQEQMRKERSHLDSIARQREKEAMEAHLAKHTSDLIKKMTEAASKFDEASKFDDKHDAFRVRNDIGITVARPEQFKSAFWVTNPDTEKSGVDKIADALRSGQLPKRII